MRRALVVVGKAPLAGQTKTRLVPPLSMDCAAALYGGFLRDTVRIGLDLGWECTTVIHPRGNAAALALALPWTVRLLDEPGKVLPDSLPGTVSLLEQPGD